MTDPFVNPEDLYPRIELDWESYYRSFKELHGGTPVDFAGRLLFPDGWQYSARDFSGPEYPPDSDEQARRLSRIYWRLRRRQCRRELAHLHGMLDALARLADVRSAQLYQINRYQSEDDDGNMIVAQDIVPLDTEALQFRCEWLEQDIAECDAHLKKVSTHGRQ